MHSYNLQKDIEELKQFAIEAKKLNIALLCGSKSDEDSLYYKNLPIESTSGNFIYKKLKDMGMNVQIVNNTDDNLEQKLKKTDVIFLNMHGSYGEDGSIQGFLNYINKPFIGSKIYGSTIGINKIRFKKLVNNLNYLTPQGQSISANTQQGFLKALKETPPPVIAKLVEGGSRIGMHKINSLTELPSVCINIAKSDYKNGQYFIEKLVNGRDFTVSIVDFPTQRIILPIMEVKPKDGNIYSQDLKLQSQAGNHVVEYLFPNDIDKILIGEITKSVLNIFKEAECSGFGRVDLIISKENKPYFLELNTLPGLQDGSNFLRCAQAAGLSVELVYLALLHNALKHKSTYE